MSPAVLDESSFDDVVSGHDIVVIGFVQERDAAQFTTLAGAVAARHPSVFFAQVHDHQRSLFDLFGLSGTTTAIFRARIGLYLEPGLPAADLLVRLLERIGALDMRRVQAELEQGRAARQALAVRRVCPAMRRGKLP